MRVVTAQDIDGGGACAQLGDFLIVALFFVNDVIVVAHLQHLAPLLSQPFRLVLVVLQLFYVCKSLVFR